MEALAKAADLNGKLDKVAQFNNLVVGFPIPEQPQLLSEDRQAFRQGFLKEEMAEIDKAYREGDLEEVVDGHIDAIYVHLGALNEMGVTPGPCFDAVHEANIAKKRGAQSKRGRSGGFDAVKPPGWKPPSHAEFLTISTQDVRDLLDVKNSRAYIAWVSGVSNRNRKADLRNITADELDVISKLRSGELKVDLNREERRQEQQEAGRVLFKAETSGLSDKPSSGFEVLHTRQVKPNDDFEYVGYGSPTFEFKLLGEDGYVLSVDERRQQADVKFYRSDLPQLMTVSLREVKYKPKRAEQNPVLELPSGRGISPLRGVLASDKPKVLVLGYARHGKDTVSELLQKKYGLKFTSSSAFCADKVVFPHLEKLYRKWNSTSIDQKPARTFPVYGSPQQCFEDRHNHRKLWFDLITAYNTPDLTALGRAIFEHHDVYCGLRNAREFHALKNAGVYDVCIWVDASERVKEIESRESCTVEPWMADYVVDNNGSVEDLERNLDVLMKGWV